MLLVSPDLQRLLERSILPGDLMAPEYSTLSTNAKREIREAMYLFNSYSLDKTFDDPENFYLYLMSGEGV
jgi:hypothetical protein